MAVDQDAERTEAARASATPLAVRIECMSCEFAAMTVAPDQFMPAYHFQTPCPYGKARPDQECRGCVHRRVIVLGTTEAPTAYRYYGQGAIWPLDDEIMTDTLLQQLGTPLRRPGWTATKPGGGA